MMTNEAAAPVNAAAWLRAKNARLEVGPAPYTRAGSGEIVVRNRAVAINPVDWVVRAAGGFAFPWLRLPFVLGSDVAGDVVEVGPGVSRFAVGDRVVAHAVGTAKARNAAAEGAFQEYTVIVERMASPIPPDLGYEAAAVLPLGLSTAACGLFQKDHLALAYPSAAPARAGQTVLVWGGSTSVGSNAIQLAVAAGYDVVTTASPRNFPYVERLGASAAFDHRSETVVRDVIAALEGKRLAGALAIGRGSPERCVDIVGACAPGGFVSMATLPMAFERFGPGRGMSAVDAAATVLQYLRFNATMALRARARRVRWKFIFGDSLLSNDVGERIYAGFLPSALAEGRFVAAPDPRVVGSGLACIEAALDAQRAGVSASKIVVSLPAGAGAAPSA